jgi:hypothetical protein
MPLIALRKSTCSTRPTQSYTWARRRSDLGSVPKTRRSERCPPVGLVLAPRFFLRGLFSRPFSRRSFYPHALEFLRDLFLFARPFEAMKAPEFAGSGATENDTVAVVEIRGSTVPTGSRPAKGWKTSFPKKEIVILAHGVTQLLRGTYGIALNSQNLRSRDNGSGRGPCGCQCERTHHCRWLHDIHRCVDSLDG